MLKKYYNDETKTLNIPSHYNDELCDIPEETENIIFLDWYDSNINCMRFSTFTIYDPPIESIFNYSINYLLNSVKNIFFGYYFNKKVDKLPKNLIYLFFGYKFNQKVDKLPKNLIYLFFGNDFNQKIDKLPKNLTCLSLGSLFNRHNQFIFKLPKNLISLSTDSIWNISFHKNIKELTIFCFNDLINNIPEHIEKLTIKFDKHDEKNKYINNLPSTLKEIVFDEKYEKYISHIPFGTIITYE